MKFLALLVLISAQVFANDIDKRPPSFTYSNGKAIFVDFISAHYKITYDISKKETIAVADIQFVSSEEGFPIFDSQEDPTSVILDGVKATSTLVTTPSRETSVRIIEKKISSGEHSLKITLPINELVEYGQGSVKSAFWMTDLSDRGYLERYLPTNFLFDRIAMDFHVKFIGSSTAQKIYSNGVVKVAGDNEYKITFPGKLNANCIYFHTMPVSAIKEEVFSYKSLDGRDLPAVVYSTSGSFENLNKIKSNLIAILDELEGDYGPFPHASVTVYIAGSGGMEYSGATMTSTSALGHELFHSYFARGVLHADGNSGWIDEALASWRDNGYQSINTLAGSSSMANKPVYNRVTDRRAYSFGERFMSKLDGILKSKGGLKPFLREMIEKKTFDPIYTEDLISLMNGFYGMSLSEEFKKYVYGKNSREIWNQKNMTIQIPFAGPTQSIHKQMSIEELRNLL